MSYVVSRRIAPSAWRHQTRARCMANNTPASSFAGRNLNTPYEASCCVSPSETADKKRDRSFRPIDRQWACTKAISRINSGDGSGNSGTGSGLGTTQRGRPQMNQFCTSVANAAVIPNHWNYSHPYVGWPTC